MSAANGSPFRSGSTPDPVALARADLTKKLPKRFYREASVGERDGNFVVMLDGRPALTPGRAKLALPTRAAAGAVTAEWAAQGETIDPATMPLTRIVNTALDGVAVRPEAVREDIVKYAGCDLLCYRASDPPSLLATEEATWDPVLAWARNTHAIDMKTAQGITFAEQSEAVLAAFARLVNAVPTPLPLACLHVMTGLTGSAVLAIAVAQGRLSVDEAWSAAHIDEDFQIAAWGADPQAKLRRAERERDMRAAARLFHLVSPT